MPERLIALMRLPYGRQTYLPGEAFIASAPDAKALVMTGRAKYAELPPEPLAAVEEAPKTYETAALEPVKRKPGRPRKGYLHRDLRADE